jgi:hypothetical protein
MVGLLICNALLADGEQDEPIAFGGLSIKAPNVLKPSPRVFTVFVPILGSVVLGNEGSIPGIEGGLVDCGEGSRDILDLRGRD